MASGQAGSVYMAQSGMLHVTSVTGTFAASLENVGFRHVIISTVDPQQMDHPDMCETTIGNALFDGAMNW